MLCCQCKQREAFVDLGPTTIEVVKDKKVYRSVPGQEVFVCKQCAGYPEYVVKNPISFGVRKKGI